MSQIKTFNISLIKWAREFEYPSRTTVLLRFVIIITRTVSSDTKWTGISSEQSNEEDTHNGGV